MTTKGTKVKLAFIKIKNCASKHIIKKVKKQSTEWEKVLTNHVSDKGLVSKYIKNSYKSTRRQTT